MIPASGFAAYDSSSPLRPWSFERRDPGPADVQIRITFCGVCHSDLHTVKAEWGTVPYPIVPGHEIVGDVVAVGRDVTRYRVGQTVAVGCMVDSCRTCRSCRDGLEQYCEKGFTGTYAGVEKETGRPTAGGYSNVIVVDQHFVFSVPEGLDPAGAAPLLCAGITTYSPLCHWKATRGTRVGVVGLGGLGHMAVKLAAAMGAEVTLFTTSAGKAQDAERLGATRVVVSRDAEAMARAARSLDLIVNTVSVPHDLDPFLLALDRDGTLVLVGAPPTPHPSPTVFNMIFSRRSIGGSLIGGVPETQEMLDFCGRHGIVSDVEIIPIQRINEAYERMLRSDVKYRFVIDMSTLA
jgi:uncharacterized zinc-type alcohol dehydrogenase-like protein